MKVLYDIANLGYGYSMPQHKTGIFRVVEALAEQLAMSVECDLQFCASNHGPSAYSYLQAASRFREIPYSHARYKRVLRSSLSASNMAIAQYSGLLKIPLRVTRKLLHVLDNTIGSTAKPLEADALTWADIYHSTYLALPQQAKDTSNIRRFITLYDLTPILLPQYFRGEASRLIVSLQNIMQSIGPEDIALCISQATKDDFCHYTGHDPARATVVYLAADPQLFYRCDNSETIMQVRDKYGIPPGDYVLGLSTLAPHKNIEHVIRAFARLAEQEDVGDLCLVLAGSKGWDYTNIFEELDAAQEIKERIIITGRVDDEDLAALYSGALAFTYMSHYEGFGLPPLEAMQCGVPVITSNTSSLPEVVGDAGILLDPNDMDGLCAAMLKIYESSDLRLAMSRKSLVQAQQFSWGRCGRETIAAYKQALAR